MSRWISWVRPDGLPSLTSRRIRSGDEPGSIEYSAVTQPLPLPRIQRGTSSSTDAVHSTMVRPKRDEHRARRDMSVKSRSKVIGRSSSGWRPSASGRSRGAHGGCVCSPLGLDLEGEPARPPTVPASASRRRWARRVGAGEEVGEDQAAGARGRGPSPRPAARSGAGAGVLLVGRRWPRTGPGRAGRRRPRATSPARCRRSRRATRRRPSARTARVSTGWSVRLRA